MSTRTEHIGLRATVEEKALLENAAEDAGLPLSRWLILMGLHVAGHPTQFRAHLNRADALCRGAAP